MSNRKLPLIIFSMLSVLLLFYFNINQVEATKEEDAAAQAAAPKGLSLTDKEDAKNYFTYVPMLGKTNLRKNSARIIERPNPQNPTTDAVLLTDDVNQLSTIWSDDKKDNYLDTNIKQTLSMWLYFGYANNPADGIAVVLQNGGPDAVDIDKDGYAHGGETLGVWGTDNEPDNEQSSVIASRAIPKSWALEFDTFLNRTEIAGAMSAFDAFIYADENKKNQHVAWNYPSNPGAYMSDYAPGGSIFLLNHLDIENSLRLTRNSKPEYAWHHLTLEYSPPEKNDGKASLTYIFNDKLTDGTSRTVPENRMFSHKIDLDLNQLANDDGSIPDKLRYGFTGATGAEASVNMAIFETMPSLVNATTNANVFDVTQAEREITSGDSAVRDGDDMKIGYNLIYRTGKKNLKNVSAKINLPEHIEYPKSGVIGQVNYSGGTVEKITADQVKDGVLTYEYSKEFDENIRAASIYVYGKARAENNAKTLVPAAHGVIEGDLYKGDVTTPDFYIIPKTKKLNIAKTKSTVSVDIGNTLSLNGTMTLTENDKEVPLSNNDVYQFYRIDGGDLHYGQDTASPDGKFNITLNTGSEADAVPAGIHKIQVYAMTTGLISSEQILEYEVNIHQKNPVLTTNNSNISVVKSEDKVNLPATVHYEDAHAFDSSDLTWHMQVNDGEEVTSKIQDDRTGLDELDWTQIFSAEKLGITDDKISYVLRVYVTDGDGGKSNVIDYNVKLLSNSVSLNYDPAYSFDSVNNSGEKMLVHRSGKWKLGVSSTESDWYLSANASKLFAQNDVTNTKSALNGDLVYVYKDGSKHPMSSEVAIAENKDKETLDYDIAGQWKNTTGVLLDLQPNPINGAYVGQINWNLSNSI